jgi:tetratricopeptide (TPR) repeat protein
MDSAKRVVAAFARDGASSGGQGVFEVPSKCALHTFLGSDNLYGWFTADRSSPTLGAGITHMVSGEYPYSPVFMRPNLNFEHIINGCAADEWRAQNTPRTDPMQLRLLSPSCVEIRWPAETSAWKLDCVMRYAFSGHNAVDMEFEVTPRANEAPQGYLVFMWASYMHKACTRTIHFPGVRGGVEGWTEFGGDQSGGGAIGGAGQTGLKWERGAQAFNLAVQPDTHFTEPVYYGLVDGDQDWETTDDAMAFIMMFDNPESTRFAIWNWGDIPHASAWDWQYVLRSPEVGRTYRHRARMVCKRFMGQDDVMAEYRSWSRPAPPLNGADAVPLRPFPAIFSPGEDGYNLVLLADKAVQSDPAVALAAYRRLLGTPLYQVLAANHIDAFFDRANNLSGLVAEWESIAAQDSHGALAWSHLGGASFRAGEMGKAAAAFQHGLERDANDIECRFGMATVELLQGEVGAGLARLDKLVADSPDHAHPAGLVCADAAKAHASAGRGDAAVQLWQAAIGYWPDDPGFHISLGELYQSTGNRDGALAQFRGVVDRDPEAVYPSQLLDVMYTERGDPAGRLREWQAVAGAHPGACVPRWHLGMALEGSGDAAGAEAAYREVVQRCPLRHEPKIWLGAVIAGRGDVDGGLGFMDEAVAAMPELAGAAAEACGRAAKARVAAGDAPGALVLLRRARVLSPADPHYRVALGGALEAAGDDNGALEEYRAVVGESPELPHSGKGIDAIYERRKDLSGRVGEWKALVARHPDAVMPQLHMGLALEASGDMAGAEAAYRSVVQRDPGNGPAKAYLGLLLAARGEVSQGLALVDEGVQARPDMALQVAEACAAAAKARLEAGDSAGALAALRRAHALAPAACHHAFALGEVLETVGDPVGAEAAYGDALKCDAGHISAKLRLGVLFIMRGDISGGLALIDAAVSARPDSAGQAAGACAAAAKKRMEAGDAAGAVAALRRARVLSPTDLRHRVALGGALEAAGDDAGALEEYRAVVAAVPESPRSSERIDAIHGRRNAAAERAAEWRRMVEAHPDAAVPQLHLGLALEAAGDAAGAEAAYRAALSRNAALDAESPLFRRVKDTGRGAQ